MQVPNYLTYLHLDDMIIAIRAPSMVAKMHLTPKIASQMAILGIRERF